MSNRTLKTSGHRGMTGVVLKFLLTGKKVSAIDAVAFWQELNLRNKISTLRAEGWPIRSEEAVSKNGGKYKIYFLDMDRKCWPKEEESA